MNKIINKIGVLRHILLLMLLLILFSCSEEIIDAPPGVSGEPALVKLSLASSDSESIIPRATSEDIETDINSLHILIFSASGKLQTLKYIADYKNATTTDKQIDTQSGNNCTIYAVANMRDENTGTVGGGGFFDNINTLSQFENEYATILDGDVNRDAGMVMCGKMVTNILPLPTVTSPPQPLLVSRLSSKITINVKDATPSGHTVNVIDYEIYNLPVNSYFASGSVDYFNKNSSLGDAAFYSGAEYNFVDASVDYGAGAAIVKQGQFYMMENRRGVRVVGNINDQRQKALYAPSYATYVVINAMYLDPNNGKSMRVAYKVFLGADNSKDYNIQRNKRYTYNISITGITQTDVNLDSRVNATNSFLFDIRHTTLDAHFEYRPMKIDVYGGWVKIEILNSDGSQMTTSQKANSWLKFSKLATYPNNDDILTDPNNVLRTEEVYSDPDPLALTETWRYLYADENVISGADRMLKIRITNAISEEDLNGTDPTKKLVIEKDITQKTIDILGFFGGNIASSGDYLYTHQLGTEHFEEYNMAFKNELPGTLKSGLKWGFQDIYTTVYGTGAKDLGRNSTNALAKNENALNTGYTPPYTLYNNYAARYCYDKNRDTNGNGTIDPAEELWYLPAINQLKAAWISQGAVRTKYKANNYLSVTESTFNGSWYVTFVYGNTYGNQPKVNSGGVRCVRDL